MTENTALGVAVAADTLAGPACASTGRSSLFGAEVLLKLRRSVREVQKDPAERLGEVSSSDAQKVVCDVCR